MTVQYEGGYFLFNEPLVRGFGGNAHTAADLTQLSNYTVEAVNYIQETPWQVNPFIFDLATKVFEWGIDLVNDEGEFVLRVNQPVDPREDPFETALQLIDKEIWQGMDKDQRKKHKQKRAKVLTAYEKALGVYRATQRVYDTAKEMSEFDQFYFPHNLDFRTRIYPIPSDLTPQSNDFSKGLLRFARPTRLGQEGYYWLGVMVATHWGKDKLRMDDRVAFAADPEFMKKCEEWVDDPFNNRGWVEADKPFQFLAAAHEWVWANRMGNPFEFMSHIPGNLDGSCNGAQHLSIMARDMVGATATNCRSFKATNGKRFDLYQEVADRVWEIVQKDALEGNPVALEWTAKMEKPAQRRKVVKRAVMTVPYGVTEYGVADFMMKEHVDANMTNQWDNAKYMRDLIMASIDETLSNGRALQRWFMECARRCAEAGLPMIWDTPAGSKVTMAYKNLIMKRVRAYGTRFYVYEEDDDNLGMDEEKMVTAAPPNVVHSCDAAHLQITVCRMYDAGIRDFSMIHDSFGCPLAQVGLMRDILRQSIVDMYKDDYLQKFKESVEWYSGLVMPEPPELGEFNIEEILESEFFFS